MEFSLNSQQPLLLTPGECQWTAQVARVFSRIFRDNEREHRLPHANGAPHQRHALKISETPRPRHPPQIGNVRGVSCVGSQKTFRFRKLRLFVNLKIERFYFIFGFACDCVVWYTEATGLTSHTIPTIRCPGKIAKCSRLVVTQTRGPNRTICPPRRATCEYFREGSWGRWRDTCWRCRRTTLIHVRRRSLRAKFKFNWTRQTVLLSQIDSDEHLAVISPISGFHADGLRF